MEENTRGKAWRTVICLKEYGWLPRGVCAWTEMWRISRIYQVVWKVWNLGTGSTYTKQ